MAEFTNLLEIINDTLQKVGEESSMLLGQELAAGAAELTRTSRQGYFAAMDDACLIAGVTSTGACEGKFHLHFSLRDAIALSSLLLGIPAGRIQEKRRLAIMESDDDDAFGEIINQVIGSFNTVFQHAFANQVHLKVSPLIKYVPESDQVHENDPLPDGDYLLFRSALTMPGQDLGRFDILIPLSLALLYDPPEDEPAQEAVAVEVAAADAVAVDDAVAAEEGEAAVVDGPAPSATASGIGAGAQPGQVEEGTPCVLILEDDDRDRRLMHEALAAKGFEVVEATLDADVRDIVAEGRVKVVVIGIHEADDRDLAVCIKIKAICHGVSLPIIMCARQWTRTGVLKAVKYGARDILMKPCISEELQAKVGKFLMAA